MKNVLAVFALIFAFHASAETILTIKKADGSMYWEEKFNTRADADKWLGEEKTRAYWSKFFTVALQDVAPPAMDPVDEAKKAAREEARARLTPDTVDKMKIDDELKAFLKDLLEAR